MSFTARMRAIVGDENSVGRYLLEKIGHTALITLAIAAAGVELVPASCIATLAYVIIGKLLWHADHGGTWSVKDLVFDTLVSSSVIVLALFIVHRYRDAAMSGVLITVLFFVLDNNAWGEPS